MARIFNRLTPQIAANPVKLVIEWQKVIERLEEEIARIGATTADLTFNNSGAGGASGTVFNGGTAKTVSYNTVGAAASGHNHDASYSAIGHDHDADYSPIGHNHDADYAAIGHDHDADYQPLDSDLTDLASNGYVPLISYTVATLPSAAAPIRMIYVSDESGGAVPAFNDGTNWRRVTDRAVVS